MVNNPWKSALVCFGKWLESVTCRNEPAFFLFFFNHTHLQQSEELGIGWRWRKQRKMDRWEWEDKGVKVCKGWSKFSEYFCCCFKSFFVVVQSMFVICCSGFLFTCIWFIVIKIFCRAQLSDTSYCWKKTHKLFAFWLTPQHHAGGVNGGPARHRQDHAGQGSGHGVWHHVFQCLHLQSRQ